MVEFIKLQKIIGVILIIIGIFFILTSVLNMGIGILISFFITPFYLFILLGALSILLNDNTLIKLAQCLFIFLNASLTSYFSYSSGFAIVLYLLSLLLALAYKFYDNHVILKGSITSIVLFVIFMFSSKEDLFVGKIYTSVNVFIFLIITCIVLYVIFKNGEQNMLMNFNEKQLEIEEMEKKLESYKKIQPDFQECINDLIRLSSEELGIIKELQSSLDGGHNGDSYRN